MSLHGPSAIRSHQRDQVVDMPVLWRLRRVDPLPIHCCGDQLFPKTGDAGALAPSHDDVRSFLRVLSQYCRTGSQRLIYLRGNPGEANNLRSYWIPGSYAPALSEKCNSFLRLWKNKGFKEERMTKVELYAIGKSTTLESNKSHKNRQATCTPHRNTTYQRVRWHDISQPYLPLGVSPLWHAAVGCDTMAVAQLRYREGAR
jgi:hypothetical protein